MKLQSLAIIFIIIIMPITIVLSEYVNNKIETEQTEMLYNTRLLNSTYDAIKAYQLNTVNNAFGDVTNSKIKDIEAAAKTFYNSLVTNFNYNGYRSEVMKDYVPAVVFTMYDGYYTYTPFKNALTELKDSDHSADYENGGLEEGLKPYVYYTLKYKSTGRNGKVNDFSIIYTLDNYITIQGYIEEKFVYDNGYLYSIAGSEDEAKNGGKGIYKKGEDYIYKGVTFTKDDTEELKEYVGDKEYSYAKINGKKYYLDPDYYTDRGSNIITVGGVSFKASTGIFFIDYKGQKSYNQVKGYSSSNSTAENNEFLQYYKAITQNKSAYEYYKNAYEFSSAVLGTASRTDKGGRVHENGYNLKGLKTSNASVWSETSNGTNMTSLKEYGDFELFNDEKANIESEASNFNQHRKAVIRYVVETNLSTAIASFSSTSTSDFLMPKISETDWETIENDVCAITFLQGMSIGAKKYNGYAVVANTLTKEYVDEDDIYILTNDGTYCKVNDTTIKNGSKIPAKNGYYPGAWKINFEQRQMPITKNGIETTIYYNPLKQTGSYTSIMGSYSIEYVDDMYSYISKGGVSYYLKKVYLYALGRERWGAYNINNINYELYGNSNDNEYFLKDY